MNLGLRNTGVGILEHLPVEMQRCVSISLSRPVSRGLSHTDGRSCPLRLGIGQAGPPHTESCPEQDWLGSEAVRGL